MSDELAFPGFDYIDQHGKQNPKGMTLRDYFAAKAMQALVSVPEADMSHVEYAVWAYRQADVMMKAREHGNS